MKTAVYFVFSFLVLLPHSSNAQFRISACMQEIIQSNRWQHLSLTMVECIAKAPGSAEGLAGLCSRNQSNLTERYTAYRTHERQYHEALARFHQSTDPREREHLQRTMQRAVQDWEIFGFRPEMGQLLAVVASAEYACRNPQ